MNQFLKNWELQTDNLKDYFVGRYFDNPTDVYWIADITGEVLVVNDYFFNLSDILNFIRYDYSKKKLFEYYDYALDCAENDKLPINIKHYKKLK